MENITQKEIADNNFVSKERKKFLREKQNNIIKFLETKNFKNEDKKLYSLKTINYINDLFEKNEYITAEEILSFFKKEKHLNYKNQEWCEKQIYYFINNNRRAIPHLFKKKKEEIDKNIIEYIIKLRQDKETFKNIAIELNNKNMLIKKKWNLETVRNFYLKNK